MESGEDFTIIDVRKPQAWVEWDTMIPESIRVPLDELEKRAWRAFRRTGLLLLIGRDPTSIRVQVWPQKLRDLGDENV